MKTPCDQSWFCRALTASAGIAVFLLGVHTGDLAGLLLMIVGLVPAVTGIGGVSLLNEIRDARAHRLERHP